MRSPIRIALLLAAALVAAGGSAAAPPAAREPCSDHDPLRRAYYGDLHVHTTFSLDASTQDTRSTPEDAYRFARGEPLGIQPWDGERPLRTVALDRPIDFAAVTDHAELFGELSICRTPGLPGHDAMACRIYRRWPRLAFFLMNGRASRGLRPSFCGEGAEGCLDAARDVWLRMQSAAEEAYDRSAECRFTSFVGYEWTGSGGLSNNLHRNVIFRDERVPDLPTSFVDGTDPRFLWSELERGCRQAGTGCDVVVIPHNSNLSAEQMWPASLDGDEPMTAEQARARASAEPLVEIYQHKGESECRRGAGTADELCSFEQLPYDTMAAVQNPSLRSEPGARNFVRTILAEGLAEQRRIGVNPYALGIIASTDTHLGTPGYVDERRHVGHGGAGPPLRGLPTGLPDAPEFSPGGLAAVWAEENSRDAIFAALRRRETFGTSGPRMRLRLFGGWDFAADVCEAGEVARSGYEGGVPMGAELRPAPAPGAAPVFLVAGLKDPGSPDRPGTDLERLQIVKLWLDGDAPRERVLDVAGDPGGGAGVDPATCAPQGSGFASLCTRWVDDDFDPDAPALYYARLLESPTCRWSTWVCLDRDVDCSDPGSVSDELAACCDGSIPKTIQERAWSSPIWYVPPTAD